MNQDKSLKVREIVSEWAVEPRHSSGQYLAEIGFILGIDPASPEMINQLDKSTVIGKMLNLDFTDNDWQKKTENYSLVLIPAENDVFHDEEDE